MPAKGRRVASRQAQLGRRRKRQGRASGDSAHRPAGATTADAQSSNGRPSVPVEGAEPSPASVKETPAPGGPAVAASPVAGRSQPRSRIERPAAYNYAGREVLRILLLSGGMVGILVILAFVLPV